MIESKKISVEDFKVISENNQYWLWHLTGPKYEPFSDIQPLSGKPAETTNFHTFREIMKNIPVPVFETGIEEAFDFILYMDNEILRRLKNKKYQVNKGPAILGFNYGRLVYSTLHLCYCDEGVIATIAHMNPKLLSGLSDS